MKRTLFILIVVTAVVLTWSGFTFTTPAPEQKKSCTGYDVIEAGVGINCYGDTIRLTKKFGYYEVAANNTSR